MSLPMEPSGHDTAVVTHVRPAVWQGPWTASSSDIHTLRVRDDRRRTPEPVLLVMLVLAGLAAVGATVMTSSAARAYLALIF
jgi:hypothetical protein